GDIVVRGNSPISLRLRDMQANIVATNGQVVAQLHVEGERAGKIDADVRTNVARTAERIAFSPNAPLSGQIRIDAPTLSGIAALVSRNLLVEGSLQAAITVAGTLAQPDLSGRIDGRGLHLLFAGSGIDLRDGVLESEFHGSQLQVTNLRFGPAGNDV